VDRWTIRRVLAWTAKDFAGRGIESARLDAELLVSAALGLDRVRLYMDLERPLVEEERARIRELVKRRRAREPVAYILGAREFWSRRFEVTPAVLVPRPETETIVERALELLPPDASGRVLDPCTGSGALGLTLAAERPGLAVDLTDLSPEALSVARRNAEALGVADRARFFEGDLFAPLPRDARYELIVCNPPYVPEADVETLEPEVRDHEPRQALVPGPTGFEIHHRLVDEAGAFLEPGGTLLVEVGAGQAEELAAAFRAAPWTEHALWLEDLSGVPRVVEVRG
jgi:release factor glutamine methyltransferase